jgi:hypothetical protein
MVYTWIISFYITLSTILVFDSASLQAGSYQTLPTKISRLQWMKWADRSKNGSVSLYLKKIRQNRYAKNKRKFNPVIQKPIKIVNVDKQVENKFLTLDRSHITSTAPLDTLAAPLPIDEQIPERYQKDEQVATIEHELLDLQNHSPHWNEPNEPSFLIEIDKDQQKPAKETVKQHTPDLSTDFALSDLEQMLKNVSCTQEMGLVEKTNSVIQPHLVNGKGVYLSVYDDRQESLAPLSPIPFLKVSSQSIFNYIEDLGVIFIPIDGTYLIKYGFSGDGMHWGEEYSSVQLTINETTIIPNSTITACQEGVMSSHSIILPLKVNDRVRLINSTPTNSLTLFQPTTGGVTAYLEMILLE